MTDTTMLAPLLRSTLLFADIDDDVLERITGEAIERSLRRGDVLFAEGDEPASLFVVTAGRIGSGPLPHRGRQRLAMVASGEERAPDHPR